MDWRAGGCHSPGRVRIAGVTYAIPVAHGRERDADRGSGHALARPSEPYREREPDGDCEPGCLIGADDPGLGSVR